MRSIRIPWLSIVKKITQALYVKPYTYYYGNDSGWYMPASFFAQPLHITDRDVILQLIPDSDALCLSQEQLASDLKQRGHRIRTQRSRDSEESVYSVRSANLVRVTVAFKNGCATALHFRQVTDVTQSLGDPIRFALQDSLDRSNDTLTGAAQRRLDLLASRLRSVSLGGIEIEESPVRRGGRELGSLATDAVDRQRAKAQALRRTCPSQDRGNGIVPCEAAT
jgi:hypothetical protein